MLYTRNYRYIRIFNIFNMNSAALKIQRWWRLQYVKLKLKRKKNIVILR